MSERQGPFAVLYWASQYEEMTSAIDEFEGRCQAKVYHAIRSYTEFGQMWAFLYVSRHEEEWEDDRAMLAEGHAYAT